MLDARRKTKSLVLGNLATSHIRQRQLIAPGARITASTRIDFGAVKIGERC